MATKRIYMINFPGVTLDADTMGLSIQGGGGTEPNGDYPETRAGITAGWNTSAAKAFRGAAGSGTGYFAGCALVSVGSPNTRVRVDRAAGTFIVSLPTLMPKGQYCSTGLRIYDTNGTTVLYQQPEASIDASGAADDAQINTNGAVVTLGTPDAGVSITTTGGNYWVEVRGDQAFGGLLGNIIFDNGSAAPVYTDFTVTDPNTTYTIGVLLSTITIQAKDQFGANYTAGGLPDMTVSSLTLPVDVVGTLTVPANQATGVWTFSNLTPTTSVVAPPTGTMTPVIPATERKVIFTTSPAGPLADRALIGTNIVGNITDLLGVTDTTYVTPVQLTVHTDIGGDRAQVIGTSIVTPVAGVFTVPLNTVALALNDGTSRADVLLKLKGLQGTAQPVTVSTAALTPTTILAQIRVPRASVTDPLAVVEIIGTPTGGTLIFEGTIDDVNWLPIDMKAYVGGAASNTFSAAFFGWANVSGLTSVRLRKSVIGVGGYTAAILNVSGV